MSLKTIRKSIDIRAPRERVWDVLLKDPHLTTWMHEFSPGSVAKTDWRVGSLARFVDHSNNGMVVRVAQNKPNEVLALAYEGVIVNGEDDFTSEEAVAFKGGHEVYRLSGGNGFTELAIQSDMLEAYYDDMMEAWDRALQKIKSMAESS